MLTFVWYIWIKISDMSSQWQHSIVLTLELAFWGGTTDSFIDRGNRELWMLSPLALLQVNWGLKQQFCVCVDSSLKDQVLGIVLAIESCILPPVKMSSSRVRASAFPAIYQDTMSLHLSQSLLSLPNSCLPFFEATNVLQLWFGKHSMLFLAFPFSEPPLAIQASLQLTNELCYSSGPSRNEFPISSSVCSASVPTPTDMPIFACH